MDSPFITTTTALVLALSSAALLASWSMLLGRKTWDPRGQHCYVTGGSTGLGLHLAILLTRKGAHVSIVARDKDRLKAALVEIEKARQNQEQILKAYSCSLNDATNARTALETVCQAHGGRNPDAVFLCAGGSRPGFFVDQDEASMRQAMDDGYWVQAWSALAASKRMVRDRSKGKIVLVSSFLGYMSIIGYSNYSPAKFALRGLAEALRSELLLYSIDVHCYFPGTMFTPGYITENQTKPKITLKIEETDDGLQPDVAAARMLRGVQRGDFHISTDLLGHIFRASTRGSSPQNGIIMDAIYGLIGWIGLPIWRRTVDAKVLAHRQEHEEYLAGNRETL